MTTKPKNEFAKQSNEDIELQIKAASRLLALEKARDSLLVYSKLLMPDPEDMDDAERTLYDAQPHHRLLCEALERVERGEIMRLAISMPPQHGKSQTASKNFVGWYSGRNPTKHVMFGTYNQDFANENGDEVRNIIQSAPHRAVFPKHQLRRGSKAKDLLVTTRGGKLAFIGRGGSGTGKPAHLELIDDPLKNEAEAESPTVRKELHGWFQKVMYSRARNSTAIIIIHTRWNEDDLIGRLCDPDHPEHDPELAKEWVYLNIPAVLKKGPIADALGVKLEVPTEKRVIEEFGNEPMAALWPQQFSLMHLASAHRLNPVAFNALYMGRPTPEDGAYFKKEWLIENEPGEYPPLDRLRFYGASDHAVTEQQQNDPSVIGCVGIDERNHIWVMPDVVWDHMETDRVVEELLAQFQSHKPLLWWLEDELISKSFGPFLRKRMMETNTYTMLDPVKPTRDKRARARAIQGRLAMKMVHFPKRAAWWRDARSQLLKFPFGAHDDFVDWLAWIGLGLTKEVAAEKTVPQEKIVRVGSMAWIKASSRRREEAEKRQKARAGW